MTKPTIRTTTVGTILKVAAIAILVAGTGCPGSPTTPPTPPPPSIIFTAYGSPPAANTVSLQLASVTTTTLTINVVATGVTGLSSAYFDLVFNPVLIHFQSATEGAFLLPAGSTSFQAALDTTAGTNEGRLVVGVAALGSGSASGSGTLATIVLTRQAVGTTGISFEAAGAFGADLTPLAGLGFSGGAVSIR